MQHVAVPLLLQFFIGASTTVVFNVCGTLAVDLNPLRPSTVSAGSNLVRCTLSAAGLAVLQVMIDRLGIGLCFTVFAAVGATTVPLLLVERRWGPTWRSRRDLKLDAAAGGEKTISGNDRGNTSHEVRSCEKSGCGNNG